MGCSRGLFGSCPGAVSISEPVIWSNHACDGMPNRLSFVGDLVNLDLNIGENRA